MLVAATTVILSGSAPNDEHTAGFTLATTRLDGKACIPPAWEEEEAHKQASKAADTAADTAKDVLKDELSTAGEKLTDQLAEQATSEVLSGALSALGGPIAGFGAGFLVDSFLPNPTDEAIDQLKEAVSCVNERVTALAETVKAMDVRLTQEINTVAKNSKQRDVITQKMNMAQLYLGLNSLRTDFTGMLNLGLQCGKDLTLPGYSPHGGSATLLCQCSQITQNFNRFNSAFDQAISKLQDFEGAIQEQIVTMSCEAMADEQYWQPTRNLLDLYAQVALEAGNVFTSVVMWSQSASVVQAKAYWQNTCHGTISHDEGCGQQWFCDPTEALMNMRSKLQTVSASLVTFGSTLQQKGQSWRIATSDRVFTDTVSPNYPLINKLGGMGVWGGAAAPFWDSYVEKRIQANGDATATKITPGPARLERCNPLWAGHMSFDELQKDRRCITTVQSYAAFIDGALTVEGGQGFSGMHQCAGGEHERFTEAQKHQKQGPYTCKFPGLGLSNRSAICNMVAPVGFVKQCPAHYWNRPFSSDPKLVGKVITPMQGQVLQQLADKTESCHKLGATGGFMGQLEEASCMQGLASIKLALYASFGKTGGKTGASPACNQLKCSVPEPPNGAEFFGVACKFSGETQPAKVGDVDSDLANQGSRIQSCDYVIRYDPLYRQVYATLPAASVMLNGYIAALTAKDQQISKGAAQVPGILKKSGVQEWSS